MAPWTACCNCFVFLCHPPVHEVTSTGVKDLAAIRALKCITEDGLVDYESLIQDPTDLLFNLSIIQDFDSLDDQGTTSTKKNLAFFLNAYNLWAIYLAYTNLKDSHMTWSGMTGGCKRTNFDRQTEILVACRWMTLYEMKHEFLLRQKDPRIFCALNNACRGAPRLLQSPFTTETVDAQLDTASRNFINMQGAVIYQKDSNWVKLNRRFWKNVPWFEKHGGLISFINKYKEGPPLPNVVRIKPQRFDWSLNITQPPGFVSTRQNLPPIVPVSWLEDKRGDQNKV